MELHFKRNKGFKITNQINLNRDLYIILEN
jgi:hypothetical protein